MENVHVRVATPLELRVALPRSVVESRKSTVPVGAEVLEVTVTVAVKVTDWPTLLGFGLLVRVTLGEAGP